MAHSVGGPIVLFWVYIIVGARSRVTPLFDHPRQRKQEVESSNRTHVAMIAIARIACKREPDVLHLVLKALAIPTPVGPCSRTSCAGTVCRMSSDGNAHSFRLHWEKDGCASNTSYRQHLSLLSGRRVDGELASPWIGEAVLVLRRPTVVLLSCLQVRAVLHHHLVATSLAPKRKPEACIQLHYRCAGDALSPPSPTLANDSMPC
ncbi:hypothetical protein CVT26_005200 [Gymnopilus dilepis]|uniref:Uncharacterized protein n=1 Tax=Gymnopilus dilepis TaxID=231916 RepID=A0A409WHB0_9AGAR|nr:hypothetical protein CVT26_005200 [Gymnopilus dilepis]